jgi:dimethylhistidine N-methyltransferase
MRHSAALEIAPPAPDDFADDVRRSLSLTPRRLSSRHFYDELGSALFDTITRLPWYHITRSELRLLRAHGRDILARAGALTSVVELGPGNGEKLAALIAGHGPRRLSAHLIDVSAAALDAATRTLSSHAALDVITHHADYATGLSEFARGEPRVGRAMAVFLGSNIGNFDPPDADALLRDIRAALRGGDSLLLGADLIKPEADLILAYDDPLGVTAAFNRNLLVRMNRELGADFDLDGFSHRAIWNPDASRVEMHLVSERTQRVRIPASRLAVTFEAGETIWTESSHKYRTSDVHAMLERAGFRAVGQWQDNGFALTLAEATRD